MPVIYSMAAIVYTYTGIVATARAQRKEKARSGRGLVKVFVSELNRIQFRI